MATLNLGRIKPVFRGAYAGGTAYVVDDIVTSGNETFICIQASTGNATSNASYWTKLAAKGTDGTDVGTTITTQGDILYRDGSGLQRLAKGTASQVLAINSGATAPEWVDASGGKTIKREYYEYSTRTGGSGSAGVVFNFTTSYVPVLPTAGNNNIFCQMVVPIKGYASDWAYFGLRFAKSGGSNYDYLARGSMFVDPNSYQSDYSCNFNIPAGDLPAGTYTVGLYAGNANAALGSQVFCLNASDHSSVGAQTRATLMLTEWKN